MKNFKRMALLLTVAALGACADQRSLETGLMPGEIHAGPPVEFVDAPIGTVIEADDGTSLTNTRAGWVVRTPAGTVAAVNAFWWDDPRPNFQGTHVYDPAPAVQKNLAALVPFIPGASATIRETAPSAMSGVTGVITVLGQEHISVPAGDYDAVHLRRYDRSNCANCGTMTQVAAEDIWFVPGVGVVRFKATGISGFSAGAVMEWKAALIRQS